MAAPVRPAGVKAFGKEKYVFVPTIANVAAPTLAEVTGASSLDLTGYLYVEGFDGVTADTGRVTAPRRLSDTTTFESMGTTSYTISDLTYAFDPQAAALSNGKKAFEKLPEGTTGYLVRRRGIDRNTDMATGQFVSVFPVAFGAQTEVLTSTDEAGEVAIRQGAAITNTPTANVALV